MTTANIRIKLQEYINGGDEKLLKLMYAIAKEYNSSPNDEFSFTKHDMELFEMRRNKRLNGESKVYRWQEARAIITGAKTA